MPHHEPKMIYLTSKKHCITILLSYGVRPESRQPSDVTGRDNDFYKLMIFHMDTKFPAFHTTDG
jgi:hypothetical protein